MAHVPVTINGIAYPKNKKDPPMPVTIVGYAWITGLKPDQGPISDAHPEHPIVLPPVDNPPPETPLDKLVTMVAKEPPPDGGWGWFPEYGWVYSPGKGGAQPKR